MLPISLLIGGLALLSLPLIEARPLNRRAGPPIVTPTLHNQGDAQRLLDNFAPSFSSLDSEFDPDLGLAKRGNQKRATTSCLNSSTTALDLNTLLYYGGANTVVSLCPGAYILLEEPVVFYAENQEISTQGYPTDDTRATLAVNNNTMTYALLGNCDECSEIALRNIQVYGARDTMGFLADGSALIEFGGYNSGQVIDSCHIWEPRGWSCLHGIEGWDLLCDGMKITNNQIGPCGMSPNTGVQFKKRDTDWTAPTSSLTVIPGSEWADGISIACKGSTVSGNIITDATDGGIVIFNAPGSLITGNTIISKTRVLMGGINAVDDGPFSGQFNGTVVTENVIIADSTMIKVGIAIGGMVWGSDNRTASRTAYGTFTNNLLSSGATGYFGYGIAVAGHEEATVLGNDASGANFGGEASDQCITDPSVPTSQAFVYDEWTTPGATLQNNFEPFLLVFLICQKPGSIVSSGPVTALLLDEVIEDASLTSSPVPSSSTSSTAAASSTLAFSSTTLSSSSFLAVSVTTSSSTTASSTSTLISTSSNVVSSASPLASSVPSSSSSASSSAVTSSFSSSSPLVSVSKSHSSSFSLPLAYAAVTTTPLPSSSASTSSPTTIKSSTSFSLKATVTTTSVLDAAERVAELSSRRDAERSAAIVSVSSSSFVGTRSASSSTSTSTSTSASATVGASERASELSSRIKAAMESLAKARETGAASKRSLRVKENKLLASRSIYVKTTPEVKKLAMHPIALLELEKTRNGGQ